MNFHILTLFPEIIAAYVSESIIKRAIEKELIQVNIYNIRDFSQNKHRKVDDYPYGGGAGMLMTMQPIIDCFHHVDETLTTTNHLSVFASPSGKIFDQAKAQELSKLDDLIILCGHYEGVDQRAIDICIDEEISIGDFILTGGELPSLVMLDAVSRLVDGVLTNTISSKDESFEDYLLEAPQYTRPQLYRGMQVPEVLINGNHKKIQEWKEEQALRRTMERRPDLYHKWKQGKQQDTYE